MSKRKIQMVGGQSNNGSGNSQWSALDSDMNHPMCYGYGYGDTEMQDADQFQSINQFSDELIVIKDSCEVTVSTTDTKAAISLQAALQAAIMVVISISIADSATAERITQDLLQSSRIQQSTRQKTIIENSRGVSVTTTDTQVAVNIQLLLQLLLALVVELDVL